MNGMKKRLLAGLLGVLMVLTLAACTSTTQPTVTASPTTAATPASGQESAAPAPEVDDTIYEINWLSRQAAPVENDAPLVLYWNEQLGIKLNIVNVADTAALNVMIAGGDVPDVFKIAGNASYVKFVDDEVCAELSDEMLSTYAPNLYAGLGEEIPGYWTDNMVGGKNYGMKDYNYWSNYHFPIVWNGQWLENVGIESVPANFEELDAALYAFAKNDPDGNGTADTYGLSTTAIPVVMSAFGVQVPNTGIFWQEKDGSVVPSLIQPEVKEALAYLNQLYTDRVLDPEFVTGENTGGYWALSHAFVNGQIGLSGMGSHYHWAPGDPDNEYGGAGANWKAVYDIDPEVAKKITFADPLVDKNGNQQFMAQGVPYSDNYTVFAKYLENEPKKLGKILSVMDYINATDPEVLSTAIYGFKGEHWDYSTSWGRQVPLRNADRTPTDDINLGGNTLMFAQPLPSIYAAAYPDNFISGDNGGFDRYIIGNAVIKPLEAFNEYGAELEKLRSETFFAIIRGERPVEDFDAFVAEWLKLGGQAIIDEAVEQYANY